jgi:phage gp36-like protein
MSQYATIADLSELVDPRTLVSLCLDAGGTGSITDPAIVARLNGALVNASAKADGYLRAFVDVPLAAPVDATIKLHVCEFAIELIYGRRAGASANPRKDGELQAAYEYFEHVRAGIIKFDNLGTTERACTLRSTTEDATPVFSTVKDVLG